MLKTYWKVLVSRVKIEKVSPVDKEILNEMVKEKKIVFYSTHILDVAEKLCSRVAIIKNGKLVKSGSMKEIKGDKSLEKVFMELEDK